ncbi:MAG: hypothetical protein ABXS91_10705 [Sulfurimonas sp.]
MLKKFFSRVMSTYYYLKGKQELSLKNDFEAWEYFHKAEKYEQAFDILIHKALAEFFLKKFDNCIITSQLALISIEEEKKLNNDEKEYLRFYVLDTLIDTLNILKKYENIEKYEAMFKNISFDINNIRKNYLDDFPISNKKLSPRSHPSPMGVHTEVR